MCGQMNYKKQIKIGLAKLFTASGAYGLSRWLNRNRLIVIYYHRVVGKTEVIDENLSGMFVREDEFERQLRWLKKTYQPISDQQLSAYIDQGDSLPQYPVIITFDDGYKDNFKRARPLLKKYNIPWTLFVTTGYINQELRPWFDTLFLLWQNLPEIVLNGRRIKTRGDQFALRAQYKDFFDKLSKLNREEQDSFIKELLAENPHHQDLWCDLFCSWSDLNDIKNEVNIGVHTHTHQLLSRLSTLKLKKEILTARQELTARLGQDLTTFAYPNGSRQDFNQKTIDILQANNFQYAYTTCYGLNNLQVERDNNHFFNLKRIGIDYFDTLNCFKMKISGCWFSH